ncbi:hypothetical protein LXJ15735_28620 [Lacrimispora xylanolytica]
MQNTSFLTIEQTGKAITIDPVEYVNTSSGIEDAPVGHIMSFMGTTPPSHYLVCDGAVYNITAYPVLSQFIKDQFGSFNFFGGDGNTTFAVPDLRNEFLRGYHGDKEEKSSGEIGIHQDSTTMPFMGYFVGAGVTAYTKNTTGGAGPINMENEKKDSIGVLLNTSYVLRQNAGDKNITTSYGIRPTNTAVLYCIKFEPTYFMSIQGMIEETTLWEGNVGTNTASVVSDSITLSDSFMNYDIIGILFDCTRTDGSSRPQYAEIKPSQINEVINSSLSNVSISFTWGFSNVIDYTDIQKTSTNTRLDFTHYQSHVKKIIGIKYKTFQT